MKKNIKIKKGLKAALSMVLCVVMLCSSFACVEPGMFDFDLSVKADAATYTPTTIGRITQEQVVGVNTSIDGIAARDFWYNVYANGYFGGHSMPTDIVIPGLGESSNYTPQGMTYWEEKNWILISAYDDEVGTTDRASCIYAIDVDTGKFVALFNILNSDGSNNTSHGGGIAVSEHNFYFADSGSNISYVPLSEFDVAENTEKNVTLQGTLSFSGELAGASTSYCCYDDGVLWVGNFYLSSNDSYKTPANAQHNSMLLGYKLYGDSSAEEWAFLCGEFKNLINVNTNASDNGATHKWAAYKNGTVVDITGDITSTDFSGELCPSYGSMDLVEGQTYVIEFVSTNKKTDMYMFAPNGGGHCNVKQSVQSSITELEDGRYHYRMEFTAGLKPASADSSWPTTQSTNGTYTGTYTIRFDQDDVQAGETRSYAITDISCTKKNTINPEAKTNSDRIHFAGTAGYPTYVVAFPNTYTTKIKTAANSNNIGVTGNFDKIQYAMVDNGRIYVSRSWARIMDGSTHISEIDVIDIDLDVPGTTSLTINNATRNDCYLVADDSIHQFHNLSMGEALCVIDDYLYTFTESAAYYYREYDWDTNKASDNGPTNVASQPVDVVWKIDQYAMMGEDRLSGDSESKVATYEKITDISQLKYTDEYMIVYESEIKDSNGQNFMYALDSYGGFKDGFVPKNKAGNQQNTADSLGMVGHTISRYSTATDPETNVETLTLYSPQQDDLPSTRWKIIGAGTGSMRLENQDTYFGLYKNLYFGSRLMYMMPSEGCTSNLDHVNIKDNGDGTFSFYYKGGNNYYLWCNDGSNEDYMDAYTSYYSDDYAFGADNPSTTEVESGVKAYAGQVELPGTFHCDAFYSKEDVNSGNRMLAAVPDKYTKFSIYRRADDINISGKSGLYTNMDAELQSDGTYTLTLESYSTGQTITKTTTEGKPIDFVFVLDTSASMQNNSDVAYYGISDNPEPYDYEWAGADDERKFKYNDRYYGAWTKRSDDQDSSWFRSWYYHSVNTYSDTKWGGNGKDYYIGLNSELYQDSGDENNMCVTYGFKKNPDKSFAGGFYWVDRKGDATRLEAMKQSTLEFIEQIAEHAEKTGIQHRISIVQYGSTSSIDTDQYTDEGYYNTGMYSTTTGIKMTNYGTLAKEFWYKYDYSGKTANGTSTRGTNTNGYGYDRNNSVYEYAFFPATHDNLEAIVNNISVTADSDTFVDHGMTMAMNAIADQMTICNTSGDVVGDRIYGTYAKTGNDWGITEDSVNANAVVINITDGAPGYSGSDGDAAYMTAKGAIDMANTMKQFDVDIYTVQMGTETTASFNNKDFLDALSSNYINGSVTSKYETTANSLTKGTANGSGYYFSYDLSGAMDLNSFFNDLWESSGNNALLDVETVTLDSDSILQHKLGDMFKLTNASKATAQTADISYDSLGVFHEENRVDSSLTPTKDVANNKVQLTGFDYSTKYIADGNAGQKLYLTIDNVLLNPYATVSDFGISNQENTAIYANSTDVTNNVQAQGFPQVNFTVPEYNYVSDFGLNMKTQNFIGTPVSVDYIPDKQEPYATSITGDGKMDIAINGTTANQSALNLSVKPTCNSVATGYTLVKRNDGGYYWAKVNVAPASNVYFEENEITDSGTTGKIEWSSTGSTDGVRNLPGDVIYGYDSNYDNTNQFSNNSYLSVDVTSARGETTSKKKAFQFTGTGFDLISACGKNTGVLTLVVKDSGGNRVKSFMVDTYHNSETPLYQVPVVSWSGDYGTYTVEVAALYVSNSGSVTNRSSSAIINSLLGTGIEKNYTKPTSTNNNMEEILEAAGMDDFIAADMELIWFDDNSVLNGGTGVEPTKKSTRSGLNGTGEVITLNNYIDGFRVYNPLGANATVYSETEKNPVYANVIDALVNLEESGYLAGDGTQDLNGIAYITKSLEDGVKLSFADYQAEGPKGELYLAKDKAIAFALSLSKNEKVMLGLRAVNGPTTFTVTSTNGKTLTDIKVDSATEMYYDITNCLSDTVKTDGGAPTFFITNTGDGMLAVNHIKSSGIEAANSAFPSVSVRSVGRSALTATNVVENKLQPLNSQSLVEIQNSLESEEAVPGVVINGVVTPVVEEEVIPDDNTNTDTGTDTENGENNGSEGEEDSESTEDVFDIFSLIKMLINFIRDILLKTVGSAGVS